MSKQILLFICISYLYIYIDMGYFNEYDYPCLCLCLELEQITIIRPRLRINRHFSQILRTEALIFIFAIPCLNFVEENKFLEILHL